MTNIPDWIQPGAQATLIWTDGERAFPDGTRLYEVAGPVLERHPSSPFFVMAPLSQSEFAGQLYREQVTLEELGRFLESCRIVRGRLSEDCDLLVAAREAPLLPLLDQWAGFDHGELLSYGEDIGAFLSGDLPLHVTTEAHRALQQSSEHFGNTWICDACGDPEDAANFLWTHHRGSAIQVRFVIQNMEGIWTCWLHPFRIEKMRPPHPDLNPSCHGG